MHTGKIGLLPVMTVVLLSLATGDKANAFGEPGYFRIYDKWFHAGKRYKKQKNYTAAVRMFRNAQNEVYRLRAQCRRGGGPDYQRKCNRGLCRADFFLNYESAVSYYYLRNARGLANSYRRAVDAFQSRDYSGRYFVCPGVPKRLGLSTVYNYATLKLKSGDRVAANRYLQVLQDLEAQYNMPAKYSGALAKKMGVRLRAPVRRPTPGQRNGNKYYDDSYYDTQPYVPETGTDKDNEEENLDDL